jgi:glutathione S-transferase
MKLYYAPGTSAVGIRILLEEVGRPYEVAMLDLAAREQYQPAFSAINPKCKVPTLIRDDGSVLTEFGAIARWLASSNPDAALLPQDPESEARAIELLDYVVGTVHMRGFSRMIAPVAFGPEAQHADIVATGREMVIKGFSIINAGLADKVYAADRYSYADPALFYVERWADRFSVPLPPNCKRHYEGMMQRPTVRRVLAADQSK